MNGATAVPWVKTINKPNIKKMIKIGNIQNFFFVNKNSIISNKSDNTKTPKIVF